MVSVPSRPLWRVLLLLAAQCWSPCSVVHACDDVSSAAMALPAKPPAKPASVYPPTPPGASRRLPPSLPLCLYLTHILTRTRAHSVCLSVVRIARRRVGADTTCGVGSRHRGGHA